MNFGVLQNCSQGDKWTLCNRGGQLQNSVRHFEGRERDGVSGELMSSPTAIKSAPNGAEDKRFPAPLASHEQVVNQPSLFWNTIKNFHSMLGNKFMNPVIGGKQLDLHVLYVEVTRRGGFDEVVKEKRWTDVGSVFKFSPTTTSASYVLRKHYSNILRQYEQVYFFQKQSPLLSQKADSIGTASNGGNPSREPQKRSRVEPNPQTTAIGKIVGKFDCGYLVVVKVGSEILHGVLYHPEQPSSSMPTVQSCKIMAPHKYPQFNQSSRRRRRKREGDPNRPKPNRSGYSFFFADKYSELKSLHPHRKRKFTKMIGESWNNLNPERREVYQKVGLKDKERYRREMKEYKERMKFGLSKEDVKASH